jgi:hypothetical protein
MKKGIWATVLATLVGVSSLAHADTFTFTATGTGLSASGSFTASPAGAGEQDITSISGTVNGSAISSFPPSSYNLSSPNTLAFADGYYFTYDDLHYTSGAPFDFQGVLFGLANGEYFDLFDEGSDGYYLTLDGTLGYDQANASYVPADITISSTATTPEPSSFLLLGTGALALIGAARRKIGGAPGRALNALRRAR